jgi:hypothetical protein
MTSRRYGFFWLMVCATGLLWFPGHGESQSQSTTHHDIAPAKSESSAPVPGNFVDVTEKLGIHFKQQASPTAKKYLLETMGSGVALFDYDNDGRLDIFFANGARIDDPTPKGTIPQKDGRNIGIAFTTKNQTALLRMSPKRLALLAPATRPAWR